MSEPSTRPVGRPRLTPRPEAAEAVRDVRAEERQQRRARTPVDFGNEMRLWVRDSELDHTTYRYRWTNETGDMIPRMESADWVSVEAVTDGQPVSGGLRVTFPTRRRVGTDEFGQPLFARLMAKRADWFAEDNAVRIERGRQLLQDRAKPPELHQGEAAGSFYTAEAVLDGKPYQP